MAIQQNPIENGMRVLSVTGEVLTRGADGNMRQVVQGEYLAPGDILVTRDGAVLLQNARGEYAEIPPNHSLTVSPAIVNLFLPGEANAPVIPSSDAPGTDGPVNTDGPNDGSGESGGGPAVNWNSHGFLRLPRINFFFDQSLSNWQNLGRDANETFAFQGRHTLNPRIEYEYLTSERPLEGFRTETDRPWWGSHEPSRPDYVNLPPVVSSPETGVTDEDVPLVLDLLKYATDPEGKPVTIISAEAGSGTVVIHPDGTITYTPNEDFHGEDTITFTVSDGFGGTTTTTIPITVNPVVDIAPDSAETDEDTPVVTDVLANDTFGPNAEVTAVTQGSGGSVTINPDGTVTYTPGPGFQGLAEGETGTDTYTYTVTTAAGNTETTTVTVIIHGINDAPVGSDLPGQSDLDGEVVDVSMAGAFSDPDATDVLTYSAAGLPAGLSIDPVTGVISGTIDNSASQDSTGTNPDGTYTVVITATDPHGASVSETFTWTVANPGPDAVDDTNSTIENVKLSVPVAEGVLSNDADPDNDMLTVTEVNGASGNLGNSVNGSGGGTFVLNGDGSYSFNPGSDFGYLAAGESTTTSITYTISDGEGGTDTATLTVTVNGENHHPVGSELPGQSDLDGEVVDVSVAGAFSDTDATDVLIYSATGLPPGLSIDKDTGVISGTIDNSASQTGTPGNPNGTYTVVITATDPQGASVNESFDWTVANPVPKAENDLNSTGENTLLTITAEDGVLENDTDPDGDDLTVSAVDGVPGSVGNSVTGSAGGTFVLNSDGSYTFDPGTAFDDLAVGESRTTSIEYSVSDGEGGTDTATLTITVNGANDAPVAAADEATVYEDGLDQSGYGDSNPDTTIVAGNVLTNDTDRDISDTKTVIGVAGGDTGSASGSVGAVVEGTYGNVSVKADGSYTYTLDNRPGTVQALAVGEKLTDTFTYTMEDSQGVASSTTLTVTIVGTNDAPVIEVLAGDSIAEALTETNAGLSTAGTLSIFDVDTSDTVTAAKVETVAVGGTYTGPTPDAADLIAMFSASGGDPSTTLQSNPNGIAWTFNSNGYAFNEIPAGETLVLTYTVRATDNHGAFDDQTVTITITGTNDVGTLKADTASINEDNILNGNVLSNDTPDPDYNEPLSVTQFTVAGDSTTYEAGQTATIVGAGSLKMNANGTYTFTPLVNYSGPVPVITYTAGNLTFSSTATLTITVNPVSDAPSWPAHTGVTTSEDTCVALNLKMPVITDNTNKNGALPGDHPERLGFITLESIDTGTQIYKGDGTTLLFTGGNNTMRIVIVDSGGGLDSSVHYTTLTDDANYASAIKLTQAEFESLRALPPANRHNDVDMTLRVTSYETDDSGDRLTAITGANASREVHVEVLAVTDPVELKIAGSDTSHSVTIDEDSSLNLKELLTTSFEDSDGSEYRSIILGNLPIGTNVNGNVIGDSGTITIPLTGGNTIPPISLTPPRNFSGDMEDISVTLRAKDTDGDSPGHTPAVKTDTVTLNLYVNPVAGDVTATSVSTNEDTGVKFLNTIALTDTDGSESITAITVKGVPTGWVVRDEGGAIVFTGNGSADYTVPAGDVASGEYKNYTITPPAHSSADAALTLTVTTIDSQTVNGVLVTSDSVTENLILSVVVHPVAEIIGTDSDGDGTADLTMNGIFNYTTPASEDVWFPLNTNGFDFKTPWTNQDADGSEKTFALLTPVLNGGADSANGSRFSYSDGTVTHYLTYFTGNPVEIPVAFLNTVQFIAPPNVSGSFEIQVQAKTVDTDPDTDEVVTGISGSAILTNLVVQPVADLVTLAVSSPVRGNEDTAIPLSIRPSSVDPSETFNVTISKIPAGSVLKYNGNEQAVTWITDGGGIVTGSVTIVDFKQSAPLTILPKENSNVDFALNVSAVSVDTSGGVTVVSPAQSLPISVDIQGVADPANLTISSPVFTEAQVDGASHEVLLSNFITGASLTDTDGSETFSLILTGLDSKFSISGATFVGGTGEGRQWIICSAALPNCKIITPANYSGTVEFDVRAVTTENDGNSLTGPLKPVIGTITPSPEAAMVTSTVADEDTLTKLNFDIQHKNGDTDESITSVSVRIAHVEGQGFSLFLGNSGTTLAAAAGQVGSGVIIDGDFYKISGTALDNIYAKGDPNSSGGHTFAIRYEVTDPFSDGTLPAVASTTNGIYTLTVNPVTDDTTTTLTNQAASNGNGVISDSTVTASGTTSISMDVVVQQVADPKAGGTSDTDGSEKLLRFVIDGVPDGVTVRGGVYIGDTPGNPSTGQWLVDISPDQAFSGTGSLTQTLVFDLDGTADFLSNLNQTISVRAVSQDGESAGEVISGASFTLTTPADFTATAPSTDVPAVITEAEFTPLAPEDALEDGGMNLKGLVDFTLTGSSPFSITLTGIPAGSTVSGMTLTMVNGEEIWTASGTGGDVALQNLLSNITVTPPENWNDNNHSGGLTFEAKLTTYTPSGEQNTAQVNVIQPVTPVSDPTEITIAAPSGTEDGAVNLTISVGNVADGAFNTIVGGRLYIGLNQTAMDSAGKLYYEGVEVTPQEVSGVTGIPNGTYYVLAGVDSGDSLALTYEPGANSSGSVTLTAALLSAETGASNVLPASESATFSVLPVNDGANVSALSPATGAEDTRIELTLGGDLIDTDGSESILSAILGNVPDGYLVYAGASAGAAVLATNLGSDGTGNSWAIGLTGGALPAYVAILPPEHFSGTVEDLSFSIISGENGLIPTENTTNFDLTVTPVADGITLNPTLSFGTEGQGVHLNLNPSMLDTDGSETVTLTLKGLGEHAAFSVGGPFSSVYDAGSDTYTLSGIRAEDIDDLSVIQSAGNYSGIQVTAYTVDGSSESALVSGTFDLNIAEKIPTIGDDILLYKTGGSFDGREGIDTLLLRPGEDIDFATDPFIRNIEILDLDTAGADHIINNLTVQDVLDITDGNNDLKILGNSGDRVNLLNDGADTWQHTGTAVEGTITFDVYASVLNSDVTVKIQQEIEDHLV